MSATGIDTSQTGQRRVFAVAAGLFAIWGLGLWLYNSLFFKFAHFFAFGPATIAAMLAAFHLAYIALVIPAVLFHRQFGFKLGVLAGLCVFGIGAFLLYLALIQHSAAYLCGAVLVIGACGAWLDTSLNPLAAISGPAKTIVPRMNLAHAFNGTGLFAAYAIGVTVLGKDYNLTSGTAQGTARPYVLVGLGAILLAFLVEQIALPAFAAKGFDRVRGNVRRLHAELRTVAGDRHFLGAALALGAYCAVLTVLWTANYRYQHIEMPDHAVSILERGWCWFAIGRIAGAMLMRWFDPIRLLIVSACLCLAAIVIATLAGGVTGWAALLSASLFLAITYPTVFGSALAGHPARIAAATALLAIAAGIGNALSSLTTTLALDAAMLNPHTVIVLALPLEAVVLAYALKTRKAA